MVASKIGKYEIIREIGRGSMGTVYAANDPFSYRRVAIKVAHSHYAEETSFGHRFRKLFFNEAHAAGVLDHPNILRVYDADMEGKLCYLVMELVEDVRTLEGYCKADTLMPLRQIVGLVHKAAKALDYAHRQGVVHRDVKPSNILLTADDDMKLSDFSVAMVTRPDIQETQFTGIMGSPLYMSPEQINDGTISGRSDLFSLGVVAYQLLTGVHPFKAGSIPAISHRICNEEPLALSEYRKDLPGELQTVVLRLLAKDPALRYASGLDLAADLALIFEDLDKVDSEDALREKLAVVERLGFFKGFSEADLWELVRACAWQRYPSGTTVIREGEDDDAFYIVLSGVVAIEKNGRVVDTLREGDCFGEMGFLSRTRRTASAVTRTDVSLMKVKASALDRASEATQLRFHKVFVRTLISRLAETTAMVSKLPV